MNTDRELLIDAAKAAGAEVTGMRGSDPIYGMPKELPDGSTEYARWNPLTDDGDALRLAVKLRMDVEPWIHGDSAFSRVLCQEVLIDEPHYAEDPYAATRRAITRAAAEIGRTMQASTSPHTPVASPDAPA